MKKFILKANKRSVLGRKVKNLRLEGMLPANIYGKNVKSLAIQMKTSEFADVFEKAGETGIIEVSVGKIRKPVLVQNVQTDPVSGEVLHADFRQVDLKEKVKATIPVEIVGESPVEKSGLGTVVIQLDEIEVEALPSDLLEKFVVDASKLEEVDSAVYVKDLKGSDKVKVLTDGEQIVVKVEPPQKEEEVTLPEAPVEGEEKPAGEAGEEAGGQVPGEEAPAKEETAPVEEKPKEE